MLVTGLAFGAAIQNTVRFTVGGSAGSGKTTLLRCLARSGGGLSECTQELDSACSTKTDLEGDSLYPASYTNTSADRRIEVIAASLLEDHARRSAKAIGRDPIVLVVDISQGISPQTRRHAYVASLAGIQDVIFAISKMDLVGYGPREFEVLRTALSVLCEELGIEHPRYIPISGLCDENVITTSERIPWYSGKPFLEQVRSVSIPRCSLARKLQTTGATRGKTIKGEAVVWFTGLSGAGKSTICNAVAGALSKVHVPVEVLDGDLVRARLSKGLTFSKEDRDENVNRIGFVAHLLSRNGVLVLVAAISPYRAAREAVRQTCPRFIEVFVNAPLDVCEARDVKGLYRKARAGTLQAFTGISDPYEPPLAPEVECRTDRESIEESMRNVLVAIERLQ